MFHSGMANEEWGQHQKRSKVVQPESSRPRDRPKVTRVGRPMASSSRWTTRCAPTGNHAYIYILLKAAISKKMCVCHGHEVQEKTPGILQQK